MSTKLTPWFDGSVKPAQPGVYQREWDDGKPDPVEYSYWTGEHWNAMSPTPAEAAETEVRSGEQRLPWRGLAADPKGGAA